MVFDSMYFPEFNAVLFARLRYATPRLALGCSRSAVKNWLLTAIA